MASALDVVNEWASYGKKEADLVAAAPNLVYRWVNQGQLRFCTKSEVLRGVWTPTIPSTGYIALPADFLREYRDKVQWSSTQYLLKCDYPLAKILNLSSTLQYSIYNGTFYVFAAAAGTPTIWYVQKPAVISNATFASTDLQIPTEYHERLIDYLAARFALHNSDVGSYNALIGVFDSNAVDAGVEFSRRQDQLPLMRGNWF